MDGWPFSERWFPRTSGTGRMQGGASYRTDFVYDDHGPSSLAGFSAPSSSSLAPPQGVYTYPAGPVHNNGADIFRTAVGLHDQASYWRVDWATRTDAIGTSGSPVSDHRASTARWSCRAGARGSTT